MRHAEPEWFVGGRGLVDPGLTARGHSQAAALGAAWADRVDAVWTSPARRAVQTAAPVLSALGRDPQVHDWLTELSIPALEGLSPEEVGRMYRTNDAHLAEAWWTGLPGSEPARAFVDRVTAGIDGQLTSLGGRRLPVAGAVVPWADLPRDHTVAVFCHAGTAGVIVSHLLGLDQVPWAWKRMRLGHTAVARLHTTRVAEGIIFSLSSFNDAEHLPRDVRTT